MSSPDKPFDDAACSPFTMSREKEQCMGDGQGRAFTSTTGGGTSSSSFAVGSSACVVLQDGFTKCGSKVAHDRCIWKRLRRIMVEPYCDTCPRGTSEDLLDRPPITISCTRNRHLLDLTRWHQRCGKNSRTLYLSLITIVLQSCRNPMHICRE